MSHSDPSLAEGGIGFVGAGAVATALALALSQRGYVVRAVASRTRVSALRLAARAPGIEACGHPQDVLDRCAMVYITVPDGAIAEVAGSLTWRRGQAAIHCSGATSLDSLSAPRSQGALVGGFHPLQTFAAPESAAQDLVGTAFGIEADHPLREELEALARALGGWPIRLRAEDRALYHASAVAACGLLTSLVSLSAELWSGYASPKEGLQALLPLVRGTLESLERDGLPTALTGPLTRGDETTVASHLGALEAASPELLPIYCHLALAALPLARAKGRLSPAGEAALERSLRAALARSQSPASTAEALRS